MRLTKGRELIVYKDPLYRTKPEGKAQLVTCLKTENFTVEGFKVIVQSWLVRFRAMDGYLEPTLYTRRIRL